MVRVLSHVCNIHCTNPMIVIGVPLPMPPKFIVYGRVVMGSTKSILYVDMDRLALVSSMMVSISV